MATQPYLPPGWTEEMYEKPKQHEEAWEALTDEQFHLLQQRRVATVYPSGTIPLPDTNNQQQQPLPAPCVEAIEAADLHEWGFVLFRTTYSDGAQWVTFRQRFEALIAEQFDASHGGGLDGVRDQLRLQWVEDRDALDGAGAADVRRSFADMRARGEVPDWLQLCMCLVVDSASVLSVLGYAPREFPEDTPIQVRRRDAPWVWAVDAEYGDSEDQDENYQGDVKVAVSSLINHLFPILATERMAPEELIPAGNDEVWFSAYSAY